LLNFDDIPVAVPRLPFQLGWWGTDWPIRIRRLPSPPPLTYHWHGIRGLKLSPLVFCETVPFSVVDPKLSFLDPDPIFLLSFGSGSYLTRKKFRIQFRIQP
jgi:hypothetical protein